MRNRTASSASSLSVGVSINNAVEFAPSDTVAPEIAHGRQRISSLDGLRSFAFLSVFLVHLGRIPGYDRGAVSFYNNVIGWGFLGVDLFFVISGYIITALLLDEQARRNEISIARFFQRRILRIWPLFYFVLLASVVGTMLFAKNGFDLQLYIQLLQKAYFPLALFFYIMPLPVTELIATITTKTSFPIIQCLSPLWSVCVEEQFYLVWPLAIALFAKNKGRLVAGILVAIAICECCRSGNVLGPWAAFYASPLSRVAPLAIGALIAIADRSKNRIYNVIANRSGCALILAAFAFFAVLTYPKHALSVDIVSKCPDYLIVVLALGILLLAALRNNTVKQFFSAKPLVELGKITYCMYLVHVEVLYLTRPFDWTLIHDNIIRHVLWGVLSFSITLAIAKLSWKLIEAPSAKMRAKLV
jgi:peptidoglycan/LPS O-acetylase OafA/YrhL